MRTALRAPIARALKIDLVASRVDRGLDGQPNVGAGTAR